MLLPVDIDALPCVGPALAALPGVAGLAAAQEPVHRVLAVPTVQTLGAGGQLTLIIPSQHYSGRQGEVQCRPVLAVVAVVVRHAVAAVALALHQAERVIQTGAVLHSGRSGEHCAVTLTSHCSTLCSQWRPVQVIGHWQ